MTTYHTRNPLGSTEPKDLFDNAENLDHRENDLENEEWEDRFGRSRLTWHGIEKRHERQQEKFNDDFQQFLLNSGYEDLGDYDEGIAITARNQVFRYDGELYRASAALELPYTTTGVWSEESALFVAIGDGVLRQELAKPDGASKITYTAPASDYSWSLEKVLSRDIRLLDYIPESERAAIYLRTSTYDCAPAMREALSVLKARGGGRLLLPEGVCYIKIDPSTPFEVFSNLTISGVGPTSVLRVSDDTGDYWGVFGQTQLQEFSVVENFVMENFCVDQNPTGNTDTNVDNSRASDPEDQNWRQFVLSLYRFKNIVIRDMVFKPCTGVNTITCNGWNGSEILGEKVLIYGCQFEFHRSNGNPDYDNSAIYAIAYDATVVFNQFKADPTINARGCIEVHGPRALVSLNQSCGYQTGVNVVGRVNEYYGTKISLNQFLMAKAGIQFWAIANTMLRGVEVSDNIISLDCANFHNYVKGITSDGTGNANNGFEDIDILRNRIEFIGTPHESITSGPGIDFRLVHTHRRFRILDNSVHRSLSPAIRLGQSGGGKHEDLVVKRNYTEGCGYYSTGSEQSHMTFTGEFTRAWIEENDISDLDPVASKSRYSIVAVSGTFTKVFVGNNTRRAVAGSIALPLLAASIQTPSRLNLVTIPADTDTGPLITVLTNTPVVYSGAGAPAGLYRCTLNGTVGELTPVNATYDSELGCYVLDGPSNIEAGSYVLVGGSGHLVDYVQGDRLFVAGAYNTSASNTPVALRKPTLESM